MCQEVYYPNLDAGKKTENCLFPFHHEIYHNSTKHKLFYHVEKVEPKRKDYALLRVSKQVSFSNVHRLKHERQRQKMSVALRM